MARKLRREGHVGEGVHPWPPRNPTPNRDRQNFEEGSVGIFLHVIDYRLKLSLDTVDSQPLKLGPAGPRRARLWLRREGIAIVPREGGVQPSQAQTGQEPVAAQVRGRAASLFWLAEKAERGSTHCKASRLSSLSPLPFAPTSNSQDIL